MNKLREKFLQLKNKTQKTREEENEYDRLAAEMIADTHAMVEKILANTPHPLGKQFNHG